MKKGMRLLLLFFTLELLCMTLCSCKYTSSTVNDNIDQVKAAATNFFDLYCNQDGKALQYLTTSFDENSLLKYSQLQKALAQNTNYKILDVAKNVEDNTSYDVTVQITNVDLSKIIEDIEESWDTSQDLEKALIDEISKTTARKKYNVQFHAYFYATDDIRLQMNSELSNALLGGLNDYVSSYIQ